MFEYDHPYFDPGTVWIRNNETKQQTVIDRIEEFGKGRYDFVVYHRPEYSKDISWVEVSTSMKFFQARYTPK